ncbi:MAG: DUF4976 domain-containing protein, partial [Opitutae bacterium]|nr:DUF4976 domain-containing protein [Opitutae bacterium]
DVPGDKRNQALCYLRDLYPAICDLAGVPIPESVEGRSLNPVIKGKQDSVYSEVYGYFRDKQRMVRDNRFKLIHYPHLDRNQLFDLQEDPHEQNDLSDDRRYSKVLRSLQEKLARKTKDWATSAGGSK